MAVYSIIVPSYNQEKFIKETLQNLSELKTKATARGINLEIILVDNESDQATQKHIFSYKGIIDRLIIEKDKGQYDAINKGLKIATGNYWTWLNTDDLVDHDGFFAITDYLNEHPDTDYIYGDVAYIDEQSRFHRNSSTASLSFNKLLNTDASISQPGSFFRKGFTDKAGELASYHFAFDYEYILRCLKKNAKAVKLDRNVSYFRYYNNSKSGSQDYRFLEEQLAISRRYGGKILSRLGLMLRLRILKRKLFN